MGLAQALLHNPEVLILDEPTTGLDPNQIVEIRKVIKDISANKTVLFSTHIMQEVQAMCNRVVIIDRGTLVANGSVAELTGGGGRGRLLVQLTGQANTAHLVDQLAGVTKAEPQPEQAHSYLLHHSHPNDTTVQQAVFHYAVANSLVLVGMRPVDTSLEHVFQQLTQSQPQTEPATQPSH